MQVANEFVEAYGIDYVKKAMLAYDKGWIGKPSTLRIGIAGDDFARNLISAFIVMMKAPRLVAPKVRRKNTISNRKLNRISR
jgi:hypothetical protein